ncbi:stage III sporulation protein AF [Clostridium sp.]|uniref:stage III sporulation protein AF n=1 Tax=Clostridium sp. TaxID=1506 RepID=UPI00262186D7|nr:stage III sporulation protein AF [uncultured Clostridium sp.]
MIDLLKVWVTNITVAIFFITAVEMILPDNNMKKYAKFVMGLMLIVVIINPIIKFFDKDFDLNSYSSKATSYMEGSTQVSDMKKYKETNIVNTTENFKENLQKECITNLEGTYPENKYNANVDVVYDSKKGVFNINNVKIEVVDSGVQRVENIKIDTKSVDASNKNVLTNTQGKQIKKLLSSKLKISDDVITVYKVNS